MREAHLRALPHRISLCLQLCSTFCSRRQRIKIQGRNDSGRPSFEIKAMNLVNNASVLLMQITLQVAGASVHSRSGSITLLTTVHSLGAPDRGVPIPYTVRKFRRIPYPVSNLELIPYPVVNFNIILYLLKNFWKMNIDFFKKS